MKNDIFIDTSGLFAFLVKNDAWHDDAGSIVKKALKDKRRFGTSDYILDETATLIKARGYGHILPDLFDGILTSKAFRIEWMDRDYFDKTKTLFLKFSDHGWSFTDCFSFVCMRNTGMREALTHDAHFGEAGFVPLLE